MKLYDEQGYFDFAAVRALGYPFNLITGGRGTGKTFGGLVNMVETGTEFIFMRRTQTQLDAISTEQFSPFRKINAVKGWHIGTGKITKQTGGFWRQEQIDGEWKNAGPPIGSSVALSTFANIRGFGTTADVLIYDEFIPEEHERPIKEEATAFFNAYESINRNRELEGLDPVQAFCFSNSNTLDNALFVQLHIVDRVEKMTRTGQTMWTDKKRGLCVILLSDSPISSKKSSTALYKLTAGTEFADMALRNEWAFDESDGTVSRPLNEYRPIVTVGDVTIYKHKSNQTYYASQHRTGSPPTFGSTSTETARFRRAFSWLWAEYMNRNIEFESRFTEILLTKYLS